jgi:hypothetical protein
VCYRLSRLQQKIYSCKNTQLKKELKLSYQQLREDIYKRRVLRDISKTDDHTQVLAALNYQVVFGDYGPHTRKLKKEQNQSQRCNQISI